PLPVVVHLVRAAAAAPGVASARPRHAGARPRAATFPWPLDLRPLPRRRRPAVGAPPEAARPPRGGERDPADLEGGGSRPAHRRRGGGNPGRLLSPRAGAGMAGRRAAGLGGGARSGGCAMSSLPPLPPGSWITPEPTDDGAYRLRFDVPSPGG